MPENEILTEENTENIEVLSDVVEEVGYEKFISSMLEGAVPPPSAPRFDFKGPTYKIDLNARRISPPSFISAELDHQAELIFFETDRFYENIDLADCICLVQFRNAKTQDYFYLVPFYDLHKKGKIIFPWNVQSPATKYSGIVLFSIKFIKLAPSTVNEISNITFELNTMVAKTKVLAGWGIDKFKKAEGDNPYHLSNLENILVDGEHLAALRELLDNREELYLYWTDV